jgi:glycosyltransferase involved in cell wall biosynthesis
MGLGVPVVASDEARTEGLIINHQTGLITPARNPRALAAALSTLLTNPTLATTLGTAAQAHVRTHFNAATQSRALEALLVRASQTAAAF